MGTVRFSGVPVAQADAQEPEWGHLILDADVSELAVIALPGCLHFMANPANLKYPDNSYRYNCCPDITLPT